MKILTVAFMLLFNYLDTLPKLFHTRCLYKHVEIVELIVEELHGNFVWIAYFFVLIGAYFVN